MKTTFRQPIRTLLLTALMTATLTSRSVAQKPAPLTESPRAAGAITIDVAAYANLCGRSEYRYREDGGYGHRFDETIGTRKIHGEPVYFVQTYFSTPDDQKFLHADISNGLFEIGGLNNYGEATERTYFWEPKVPLLMKNFVPGREYTQNHTQTAKGHKDVTCAIGTTTEPETITVPYGTLDCYKVTRKISVSGKLVATQQEWYAKHLGMVKSRESGGSPNKFMPPYELVAYRPAPRLVVEQPAKTALFDGVSKKSFGTRPIGKPGLTKTFTLRNLGTEALTGLSISKNGRHPEDFIVSAPVALTLDSGNATTFTVTFAPTAKDSREAAIHVFHTESKGNPFDIKLTGMGVE